MSQQSIRHMIYWTKKKKIIIIIIIVLRKSGNGWLPQILLKNILFHHLKIADDQKCVNKFLQCLEKRSKLIFYIQIFGKTQWKIYLEIYLKINTFYNFRCHFWHRRLEKREKQQQHQCKWHLVEFQHVKVSENIRLFQIEFNTMLEQN